MDRDLFDLLFQVVIFLTHSAQIKVVAPQIADAALKPDDTFFKRSNCIHYPDTDQTARFVLTGALDLDCKSQHLGKQNRHQDGDVAVAADQVFHGRNSEFPVSGLKKHHWRHGNFSTLRRDQAEAEN